jgi:hypothetical protein
MLPLLCEEEVDRRVVGRDILGLNSLLRPLDGDNAEKRWWWVDDVVASDPVAREVTLPVDALRSPLKEIESRLLFLGRVVLMVLEVVAEVLVDVCRTARNEVAEAVEGEERAVDLVPETVLAEGVTSLSNTPNSFVELIPPVGEGPADEELTIVLALLSPLLLRVPEGDEAAEVRLEILGIFVGVSFGSALETFKEAGGGPSFSLTSLLDMDKPRLVPTDGEPAMVGSWTEWVLFLTCFCMELTVWEVNLEDDDVARVTAGLTGLTGLTEAVIEWDEDGVMEPEFDAGEPLPELLRRATLWAVAGSIADIWRGGRLTGDFGFFGVDAEERVCRWREKIVSPTHE